MSATYTRPTTVTAVPAETLKNIAMVGHIVTWQGEQFTLYSVEGYDYYAFQSSAKPDTITVDFSMTPSEWRRNPRAFLLPMGYKIGDGLGFEVHLKEVRKGVSLAKV